MKTGKVFLNNFVPIINKAKNPIVKTRDSLWAEALDERQNMLMQKIISLQNELTQSEMEKIKLQTRVKMVEQKSGNELAPQEILQLRYDFINADSMVQLLTNNVSQLEQDVI